MTKHQVWCGQHITHCVVDENINWNPGQLHTQRIRRGAISLVKLVDCHVPAGSCSHSQQVGRSPRVPAQGVDARSRRGVLLHELEAEPD